MQRDLARLNEQMKRLFPGETIDAQSNGKSIVLSGQVSNKDTIDKAINVAARLRRQEATKSSTCCSVQESTASNQVLLRVRFAEVSRSAMTELGRRSSPARTAQGRPRRVRPASTAPRPCSTSSGPAARASWSFSDFLNLFLFDAKYQLGTVIKALQTKGQFQSLAEPNLVAESGKEASFLAGGEFPVPIAQGGAEQCHHRSCTRSSASG